MSRPTSYAMRCLREFEEAVRTHEFMGAQHPDDHEQIEANYQQAKEKLKRQLKEQNPWMSISA